MDFKGKIIFLAEDEAGCIRLYKKMSKEPAELSKFKDYLQTIKVKLNGKLKREYIINQEDKSYIWSSCPWSDHLNGEIRPYHQKYLDFLAEYRPEIRFIGPYKSMRIKGLHICSNGHEWNIQPLKVKNGETCPRCKKRPKESNGAIFITGLLKETNIEFIKELSIQRFGHDRMLYLDFVICKNGYPLFVIEFNGIQHYKVIRGDYFEGYKGLRKRKERDKIKRDYCWSIGIPIVDIPYTENEEQIRSTISYFLELYELS